MKCAVFYHQPSRLSYLREAELGVSQRQALVSRGVEVRLCPAVGDKGAVHLRGGHVQFVLLKEDETKEEE